VKKTFFLGFLTILTLKTIANSGEDNVNLKNPILDSNINKIMSFNDDSIGFEEFKKLKKYDHFKKKSITKTKKRRNKKLFSTEEFFLSAGTKVIFNDEVVRLPRSLKIKVLYNPKLEINNVIDKSGKIVFQVRTKNLIPVYKSEGIEFGSFDVIEEEKQNIPNSEQSKIFLRFGYGGSLFEDSFNNQFLTGVNDKIYAGCLELQLEGFIQSSEDLHFGVGSYLTTGQYVSVDEGPVFQNLSIGPLVKYSLTSLFFLGAGVSYTVAHDITVDSAINIQNVFFEKFINLEILDKKNVDYWAFGLKFKFIDHKVKFQEQNNSFNKNQTSISVGAYVSKGISTFSF